MIMKRKRLLPPKRLAQYVEMMFDDGMRSKERSIGVIQGIRVGETERIVGVREWVIVVRPVIVSPPIVGRQ